ncbi:hypothetical protein IVB14_30020 [Bradyrhizobium sp. 180]|uniref:hypothetical protein n=1 Tax=unclassified Bradyrhizobium TaxID=2631580 RepID=UPI001FFA1E56|nr:MULTISPECIES: hypothetical protein [unclassified Bradyrhizobium]MCK1419315.1 hypothetical protein [Bradyrhizobium sp. CW12]MCK1494533.1 hypothetical protein [Bradyrhizobium sp. 180]MCK1526976.1 hypothetical protein [Bradyrhizobium sp. 182]MCK1620316.1 hypothetical protein [Bradyrhizobium sp. 159]MCK1645318.1 hypothetical protein [Bradyrhizobium sp. 154]
MTWSLDQIWRWPAFPMWMTLLAAGFFGLILLITLLRADRSVANGALTVITLLSIAIAGAATVRVYGSEGQATPAEARAQAVTASLPALSCLDDLAGDAVAVGCEKALFGAPEAAAAAVSYTAARIDRLTALGDVATAEKSLTLDLKVLRKSLERDRYGLVAHVLVARDGCTQFDCAAFRSLTDQQQVAANMDSHRYDTLVARYAPTWNAPATALAMPATGALSGLPPSMPTGKPTNAEFPSASSTPPVSIMNPEPPTAATRQAAPAANAAPAARAPAAASAQAAAPAAPTASAAKKPPAPKAARSPAAPVPLAPPPASAAAPAAADNE